MPRNTFNFAHFDGHAETLGVCVEGGEGRGWRRGSKDIRLKLSRNGKTGLTFDKVRGKDYKN